MTASHLPFAVLNWTVNPLVRALLRSPAHGILGGRLALITLTGRRSGRSFTFPVGYRRQGDHVTINVGAPDRKRWWRNLRHTAPVTLVLDGVRRTGSARATCGADSRVTVDVELDPERS